MIFLLMFLTVWVCAPGQNIDSATVVEEAIISSEPETESDSDNPLEIEIGQLIIDNTFSKAGSDFQQLFSTQWNWPQQNAEQFIITVSERPSFLSSTLIEISVNELKVFERFLQPRYDVVEEITTQAIEVTLQYILNYEDVVRQLGGEDLSGSGIY